MLEKEIAVLQSPRAVKSKDSGATVDNRYIAQEKQKLLDELSGLAQSNEGLRREDVELKQKIFMARQEIKMLHEGKR